jgi:hypothetical protein
MHNNFEQAVHGIWLIDKNVWTEERETWKKVNNILPHNSYSPNVIMVKSIQ